MPEMTPRNNHDGDLDVLAQKYVSGELSECEAERLLALLASNSKAADSLLGHLSMDAMLRELGKSAELPLPENVTPFPAPKSRGWKELMPWLAIAACVTLAATLGVQRWMHAGHRDGFAGPEEHMTRAVAVLTRAAAAEWDGRDEAPRVGTPLEPGMLRLKSGMVQVEFFTGARVLLEGPAELQLISAGEAYCPSGRLSAEVPRQARGFRIGTPQGTVVDLGTEFGLDVNAGGAAVHVLKGEVELHRTGDALRPLKEGQALELAKSGEIREVAANAAAFANRAELQRQVNQTQKGRLQRWKAAARIWNSDPALLARFDFEPEDTSDLALQNVATPAGEAPVVADAAIVGCNWTQGRWPGKRALEFRSVSDRARLEVPQSDMVSATLSAWVRVDGVDREYNSMFMTEGFGRGALHWQILRNGKVRLGVGGSADYDSPQLFTPERLGRWTHVAVVFDGETSQVRHYANGQLVVELPLKKTTPLHLGLAELGNWNPSAVRNVPIRHFSGAMDEFALWGRVLSEAEIQEVYAAGS